MPILPRLKAFTLLGVAITIAILGSVAAVLPSLFASNQDMRNAQVQKDQAYFSSRAALEFAKRQIIVDGNPSTIPTRYFGGTAFSITRSGGKVNVTTTYNGASSSFSISDSAPVFSLAAPINYDVKGTPLKIKSADFNSDGFNDLISSNDTGNNLSIWINNDDGTFSDAINLSAGSSTHDIDIADIDQDNILDLAVISRTNSKFYVFKGYSDGTFNKFSGNPFNGGSDNAAIAVADVNNDGKKDIFTANFNPSTFSVFRGNGIGSAFTLASTAKATATNPFSIVAADFNNDNHIDSALAAQSNNKISIMRSTSPYSGTSFSKVDYSVCTKPYDIVSGYFNADAYLDIAVSCFSSNQIAILKNSGTGTFSAATYYAGRVNPSGIDAADLNGDNKIDIAMVNNGDGKLSVYLGTGTGTFLAKQDFDVLTSNTASAGPSSVVISDVDRDGKKDIVVANYNSKNISVLINTTH
jgi:type II secretory pathway pseudopilin PulG